MDRFSLLIKLGITVAFVVYVALSEEFQTLFKAIYG